MAGGKIAGPPEAPELARPLSHLGPPGVATAPNHKALSSKLQGRWVLSAGQLEDAQMLSGASIRIRQNPPIAHFVYSKLLESTLHDGLSCLLH